MADPTTTHDLIVTCVREAIQSPKFVGIPPGPHKEVLAGHLYSMIPGLCTRIIPSRLNTEELISLFVEQVVDMEIVRMADPQHRQMSAGHDTWGYQIPRQPMPNANSTDVYEGQPFVYSPRVVGKTSGAAYMPAFEQHVAQQHLLMIRKSSERTYPGFDLPVYYNIVMYFTCIDHGVELPDMSLIRLCDSVSKPLSVVMPVVIDLLKHCVLHFEHLDGRAVLSMKSGLRKYNKGLYGIREGVPEESIVLDTTKWMTYLKRPGSKHHIDSLVVLRAIMSCEDHTMDYGDAVRVVNGTSEAVRILCDINLVVAKTGMVYVRPHLVHVAEGLLSSGIGPVTTDTLNTLRLLWDAPGNIIRYSEFPEDAENFWRLVGNMACDGLLSTFVVPNVVESRYCYLSKNSIHIAAYLLGEEPPIGREAACYDPYAERDPIPKDDLFGGLDSDDQDTDEAFLWNYHTVNFLTKLSGLKSKRMAKQAITTYSKSHPSFTDRVQRLAKLSYVSTLADSNGLSVVHISGTSQLKKVMEHLKVVEDTTTACVLLDSHIDEFVWNDKLCLVPQIMKLGMEQHGLVYENSLSAVCASLVFDGEEECRERAIRNAFEYAREHKLIIAEIRSDEEVTSYEVTPVGRAIVKELTDRGHK